MQTIQSHCGGGAMDKKQYGQMERTAGVTNHKKLCTSKVFVFGALGFTVLCILIVMWYNTNQVMADDVTELDEKLSVMNDRIQQNAEREATDIAKIRKDISGYLFQLQQNLTQMWSKHADDLAELQQQDTNSSHLMELHRQRLEQLKNQLDNARVHLNKEIGQAVNIFEHCKSIVDSCVVGTRGDGPYWKACRTKFFPKEEQVGTD